MAKAFTEKTTSVSKFWSTIHVCYRLGRFYRNNVFKSDVNDVTFHSLFSDTIEKSKDCFRRSIVSFFRRKRQSFLHNNFFNSSVFSGHLIFPKFTWATRSTETYRLSLNFGVEFNVLFFHLTVRSTNERGLRPEKIYTSL